MMQKMCDAKTAVNKPSISTIIVPVILLFLRTLPVLQMIDASS